MVSRLLTVITLILIPVSASAQPAAPAAGLSNAAFQIRADATGITSLKHTGDVADTDYIAARGSLGRLLVRYRTAVNGDWKELHDPIPAGSSSSAIRYVLGAPVPSIAARASGSAVQGVGGIRALNDGLIPSATIGGGR